MDSVYVESSIEQYLGNAQTEAEILQIKPVESGNYYYFTVNGLSAVQMNNQITSVLYGRKAGQLYCSPVDAYCIADYAYGQLNSTASNATLKTLCADLLRYGAAAQSYKQYRTDAPVDRDMTETHKSYLSDLSGIAFGNTNLVLDDVENAPIQWVGKLLNLESKVELKFVFAPRSYSGDLSDLTLRVSYTDIKGNLKTLTLTNCQVYNQSLGYHSFTLDSLLAAELRAAVSVQIYAGDTPVSCTLQYSADTYGANTTGSLQTLCKSLLAYSDSAKAYFTR